MQRIAAKPRVLLQALRAKAMPRVPEDVASLLARVGLFIGITIWALAGDSVRGTVIGWAIPLGIAAFYGVLTARRLRSKRPEL
ncbi:MAG: hypothetical protein AAB289_04460, partial [Chloroflexota bacterium]